MRTRHALAIAALVLASCTSDEGDDAPSTLRTFDLDATEVPRPSPHPEESSFPDEWEQHVEVVVIEAPTIVTAAESFELVLELRNRSIDPITPEPCPSWRAGMGESAETSFAVGPLPCDDIGEVRAGERIRLRMQMPATKFATTAEGGEFVNLSWCIDGGYNICQATRATIALPMRQDPEDTEPLRRRP